MSRMHRLCAATGAVMAVLIAFGAAHAQQQSAAIKIPQLKLNRGAPQFDARQLRNNSYTLNRLQNFQAGVSNARASGRAQVIRPPVTILGR
jgi:hypothetical protein